MADLGFVFGKGHAVFFAKNIFKSYNSKDCITKALGEKHATSVVFKPFFACIQNISEGAWPLWPPLCIRHWFYGLNLIKTYSLLSYR